MQVQPDRWYTVGQAAEWLSVSTATVRRMIKRGELPSRRLGRRWYVAGYSLVAEPEKAEKVSER